MPLGYLSLCVGPSIHMPIDSTQANVLKYAVNDLCCRCFCSDHVLPSQQNIMQTHLGKLRCIFILGGLWALVGNIIYQCLWVKLFISVNCFTQIIEWLFADDSRLCSVDVSTDWGIIRFWNIIEVNKSTTFLTWFTPCAFAEVVIPLLLDTIAAQDWSSLCDRFQLPSTNSSLLLIQTGER